MQSVQKGFASAKAKGVPCAKRLMKEITAVCQSSSYEVKLINDSLQQWEVSLFDWAFDESSALHQDLAKLSDQSGDLVPLLLRISFPDDFPFVAPLVFASKPTLESQYIFDGALCMEMLVDWQPTYGNVEALLVQICAFLSTSSARVQSLVKKPAAGAADEGAAAADAAAAVDVGDGAGSSSGSSAAEPDDSERQRKAQSAYTNLKRFHDKKGWGTVQGQP